MEHETSKILENALKLSDADRAEIAGSLIDSLHMPFDQDAESAWSSEIAKRLENLDSGHVKTVPWPVAREQILGDANS